MERMKNKRKVQVIPLGKKLYTDQYKSGGYSISCKKYLVHRIVNESVFLIFKYTHSLVRKKKSYRGYYRSDNLY